jgi:hypothetical protein
MDFHYYFITIPEFYRIENPELQTATRDSEFGERPIWIDDVNPCFLPGTTDTS